MCRLRPRSSRTHVRNAAVRALFWQRQEEEEGRECAKPTEAVFLGSPWAISQQGSDVAEDLVPHFARHE
eukprot:3848533-Pyramimonas_sp.AAC.1